MWYTNYNPLTINERKPVINLIKQMLYYCNIYYKLTNNIQYNETA